MAKYSIPDSYSRIGFRVIQSHAQAYQLLRRYLKMRRKLADRRGERSISIYEVDKSLLFVPGNYFTYTWKFSDPKNVIYTKTGPKKDRTSKKMKAIKILHIVKGKSNG